MSNRKRYKRIVLHAGLHKTGTTSIQDNCYRLRDWLLQHDIVYPHFLFDAKKFVNHSDPLAATVATEPKLYGALRRLKIEENPSRAISTFSEQVRCTLETPKAGTLLLSGEHVCNFTKNDLKRLRDLLEPHTESLEVIALVRSPQSSLESMLQQRCRGGSPSDPASLVNVVRSRYLRLKSVFPDILRVSNFHEAIKHPHGVVGWLFCDIGLPPAEVAELEFRRSNERVSMEAFLIMDAINRACPVGGEAVGGLHRLYNDMHSLSSLPGQRFQLQKELSAEVATAFEKEADLLEQELQFSFPPAVQQDSGALWQPETLLALESVINNLDVSLMRDAAAAALDIEAAKLERENPDTSAILSFIASQVRGQEDPPIELILEKLGADYFKFSALQLQEVSTEMSLLLMLVAQKLRPDAGFIEERIQHYRDRLAKNLPTRHSV